MVTVAQLVEPRIVIPVVVGSKPISHPILQSQRAPSNSMQYSHRYASLYPRRAHQSVGFEE